MKNLILLALVALLFSSCQEQEQRYFADSAETDIMKAAIAAYESGNWDEWRTHFADTAKIYANTTEAVSLDDRQSGLAELTSAWENYGFDKDESYWEMVIDKENEKWTYFWSTHTGRLKGSDKTISIPVHIAMQFVDGKIVEEHVFFDSAPINAAMAEMAAAAAAEESADEGNEE